MKIKSLKSLCAVLAFLIAFSFVNVGAVKVSADGGSADFGFSCTLDKTEFDAGDTIVVSAIITNNSEYVIGEVVSYIEYDGDVTLSPVCPEVDINGGLSHGSSVDLSLSLRGEKNSIFMRVIYKALMFITRNFVMLRQRVNNISDIFSLTSLIRHRKTVGTCRVKYDGRDVEIKIGLSYVVIGKAVVGNSDISFAPLTAEQARVSDEDISLCKDWFYENVVYAGSNGKAPAYNFTIGGKDLRSNLADWEFETLSVDRPYEKYPSGKVSTVKFTSGKYNVEGRVEGVVYENNATCEWTVYLKNTGTKNSSKIKDFNAVESALQSGKTELYASIGSTSSPSDFTLFKLDDNGEYEFGCRSGRSSDYYMPYFNLCGENFGVCVGIGWSGQWLTDIAIADSGADVTARQEKLNASLLPDEEIRSPLVSMTFYKHENPIKGFNIFRDWVRNSLLGDRIPDSMLNVDAFFVSSERTAEQMIYDLNNIPEERYEYIDNLWMDAGWYCDGGSWSDNRFGVWRSTESRFPSGIKEISGYAKSRGAGLVLWYEEERLSPVSESELYTESLKNKGWTLGRGDTLIWNFADKNAQDFISRCISTSLKENGVTIFREYSNFDPLSYWEWGDKNLYGGRNGITENHYVQGHYEFLDYLFADNENLEGYDCCASGGRRLDLEVIRRGVPLWRSDYNCAERGDTIEATQSQTYSASFWLPYTGTYYYVGNTYRERSTLYQGVQVFCGDMANDTYRGIVEYKPLREMMNGNFYPISFGGTDKDKVTAMQYGDEKSGFAVVYKRCDVSADSMSFALSGLDPDTVYSVYNYDSPEDVTTASGESLMADGITAPFADGDEALIYMYSIK